jgi:hypothetical protein
MPHVDAMEMAVHLAVYPPSHVLLARAQAAPRPAAGGEHAAPPMTPQEIAARFGGRVVSGGRRG